MSGTYDYGGRTTIDGVRSDDLENNSRVGVTLALPVNDHRKPKTIADSPIAEAFPRAPTLNGRAKPDQARGCSLFHQAAASP